MSDETKKPDAPEPTSDAANPLLPTSTRYLDQARTLIHLGTHGVLHVTVREERIYGGVYAVLLFPVWHPQKYISLRYTNSEGEGIEVGILRDLADWPAETQALVRQSLKRRYFFHIITRIHDIAWKWGFIGFEVETDKGRREFLLRWQGDRAVAFGRNGKMLLDVDDNRYLIPDLEALSAKERTTFLRFIYW